MVLKNKKTLRLVVCMSLIVALAISALALTVGATYENTHANSGDQAQDIVSVAQTQVGYSEGSGGYTKYGDWYGLPNSDWCAMFVSWCADQAGVESSVFQSFALCSAGCDWFISQGRFNYKGSYTPQAGDLIFYASNGNIYHVGLVTGSDGSNVYSIEGNYSDKVSKVSYSLSYSDILGYATPNYATATGGQAATVTQDSDTEEAVSEAEQEATYTEPDAEEPKSDETEDTEDTDDEFVDEYDEYIDETGTDSEEEFIEDTEIDSEDSNEIESTEELLVGDVNGDGYVTAFDALIVRASLAGTDELSEDQYINADVDGSGNVDMVDVIIILKISANVL